MRRIYRRSLKLQERLTLFRLRKGTDRSVPTTRKAWEAFRRSKAGKPVTATLEAMSGKRIRCAYCSDSHASDIDHFKPLAEWPESAFMWENMILCCTTCNRKKGKRFPTANDGSPRLINPSRQDPWLHLTMDPQTGVIAPRYLEAGFDEFGEATLEILETINYESVVEGRRREIRRIVHAFSTILNENNSRESRENLAIEVTQDDLGIARWFAIHEGRDEDLFSIVRNTYPATWRSFIRNATKSL